MSSFKYNDITQTITGVGLEGAVRGLENVLNFTVDYEQSNFNHRVSKVTTDKGVVKNLRWCQTLRKLVTLGGGSLADEVSGVSREVLAKRYTVQLQNPSVEAVEDIAEDTKEPVTVEDKPTVAQETPKDIKPIPSHYTPVPQVDLEYAKTLLVKGKEKPSRKALDRYAECFGIKLNGRKTFANMLIELEEKCSVVK